MNSAEIFNVAIFSDANALAFHVVKKLVNKNCNVVIFSKSKRFWLRKFNDVVGLKNVGFSNLNNFQKYNNISHVVFFGGFIKRNSSSLEFKKFIINRNFGSAKSIAIFPYEVNPFNNLKKVKIGENAGIIYIGDLFGRDIDLDSDLLTPQLTREVVKNKSLTLGVGEIFFPIEIPKAAEKVIDLIETKKFYGHDVLVRGTPITSTLFWKKNKKLIPDLRVIYKTNIKARTFRRISTTITIKTEFEKLLSETHSALTIYKKPKDKKNSIVKTSNYFTKYVRFLFLAMLVCLLFPLVLQMFSFGLMLFSYKQFMSGNADLSQKTAGFAKSAFILSREESVLFTPIPLIGRGFREINYIGYLGEQFADGFLVISPLSDSSRKIITTVFGNEKHDITEESYKVKTVLEYVFIQISLIQIETQDKAGQNVLTAKQVLNVVDFEKTKKLVQESGLLLNNLPALVGSTGTKQYLILFENNMELRPTGGFIGSYGIANFTNGQLKELNINDIYSADGQLKGHVEPPEPIKKYLGEANWFFRDSNWDPDFRISAKRAEWFLEKEMGQKVDGVIAIDLNPIKNLLEFTGPIFLPDYNLTITKENLYEKTQTEAERDFFPGSRKKASFLTALSRTLINEIPKMNSKKRIGLIKTIHNGLEGRNIQLYLHDTKLQDSISNLNWDGKIPEYSCGKDCYSDFFGIVEANLGVNKSNLFIDRKIYFKSDIKTGQIKRTVSVIYKNNANPSLGESGIYQTYVRLMSPLDSRVESVRVTKGSVGNDLGYDLANLQGRQETGTYFEIKPQEEATLSYTWISPLPLDPSVAHYGLYVRKQAGTESDFITLELVSSEYKLASQPIFSLTKDGIYTYNATLGKDLFVRTSLNQK